MSEDTELNPQASITNVQNKLSPNKFKLGCFAEGETKDLYNPIHLNPASQEKLDKFSITWYRIAESTILDGQDYTSIDHDYRQGKLLQDLNRQHEAEDDSFTIDDFGNLVNTKNITPAYGGKFECNYLDNEGVRHKRLHTVYVHGIQEEISQGHVYIVIGVICLLVVSICLAVVFCCYCCKKSKSRKKKEVRDKGGSQMVESDSKPIEKITEVPGFHQKNGSQMLAYDSTKQPLLVHPSYHQPINFQIVTPATDYNPNNTKNLQPNLFQEPSNTPHSKDIYRMPNNTNIFSHSSDANSSDNNSNLPILKKNPNFGAHHQAHSLSNNFSPNSILEHVNQPLQSRYNEITMQQNHLDSQNVNNSANEIYVSKEAILTSSHLNPNHQSLSQNNYGYGVGNPSIQPISETNLNPQNPPSYNNFNTILKKSSNQILKPTDSNQTPSNKSRHSSSESSLSEHTKLVYNQKMKKTAEHIYGNSQPVHRVDSLTNSQSQHSLQQNFPAKNSTHATQRNPATKKTSPPTPPPPANPNLNPIKTIHTTPIQPPTAAPVFNSVNLNNSTQTQTTQLNSSSPGSNNVNVPSNLNSLKSVLNSSGRFRPATKVSAISNV